MRIIILSAALMLLSACVSQFDMQGVDPKDYYAAHPKKNRVETRLLTHTVTFASGQNRLSGDERERLVMALRDASPAASEALTVELPPAQVNQQPRRDSLRKMLRSMGYVTGELTFLPAADVGLSEARITLAYAVAVPPECPDWRLSPVTTYSNTSQGNFGCATTVNLGLQVADPRDLERGQGQAGPDGERNSLVVQQYRQGKDYSPSAAPAAGDAASSAAPTPTQ